MIYEAQIVLRRDDPVKLAADFEAISAFIKQREQMGSHAAEQDPVSAAERILRQS